MSITREQIKFLRRAARVIFSHSRGSGEIRVAIKTKKTDRHGYPIEEYREFPVESSVKSIGSEPDIAQVASCHHVFWSDCGGHGSYWRTIAGLLRVGDVLSLKWGRGYESNGYLEDAGLIQDRLSLWVQRGSKQFTFLIPTAPCKDNTARTIRRGPFNMD